MFSLWLVRAPDDTLAHLQPVTGWSDWIFYKSWLSLWLGVSHDVLHIFAGLLLLIATAFVSRRPPWNWLPWLVTAAAELLNEGYDLVQTTYFTATGNYLASLHDFVVTMFWPTVIVVAFPGLVRRSQPDAS